MLFAGIAHDRKGARVLQQPGGCDEQQENRYGQHPQDFRQRLLQRRDQALGGNMMFRVTLCD
jgi:hypothetical protein